MIELPESATIAAQLLGTVKGKIISKVTIGSSPHKFAFYTGDQTMYSDLLEGLGIDGCVSYGGIVEIQAEGAALALNDGAYPRYWDNIGKAPKKHQLLLRFDDDSCITATVRMYGGIFAFRRGDYSNPYYAKAVRKTSPLSDAFTYDYFRSLALDCGDRLSIKAFLATKQRIPGLGNGVLQDIAFQAKMNPKKTLSTLTEEDWKALYQSTVTVLNEMTDLGGRDVERDLFGNYGRYRTYLSKKTLEEPCPGCGAPIHKASYLGGNIYFCSRCQRL